MCIRDRSERVFIKKQTKQNSLPLLGYFSVSHCLFATMCSCQFNLTQSSVCINRAVYISNKQTKILAIYISLCIAHQIPHKCALQLPCFCLQFTKWDQKLPRWAFRMSENRFFFSQSHNLWMQWYCSWKGDSDWIWNGVSRRHWMDTWEDKCPCEN